MTAPASIFFAGGGTGGHIYPGIAVAEQIRIRCPQARIHFFCSQRSTDTSILAGSGFSSTALPAAGFSLRPAGFLRFCRGFIGSAAIARRIIAQSDNPVVVGIGGFVAAPVCRAGHKLRAPVALISIDAVPGKANRLIGRWAREIFVQFDDSAAYFAKSRAVITTAGCPLRSAFDNPQPKKAADKLGLETGKKVLLVTGGSSGSARINEAVIRLLPKLDAFCRDWQIVHITGRANFENIRAKYASARIPHRVQDYFEDMADLLAGADLVIGRSGGLSVAEYAAAGAASICMPYPHHRDLHQYKNAGKLVEAGAAVIVDDLPDADERAEWLWEELEPLMQDDQKRAEMKKNCAALARKDAAARIAERLLEMAR